LRARPSRVWRRRIVLTQRRGARVVRLQRHVRRALPVGRIELEADVAVVLPLLRVEVVAGQFESITKIGLERSIAGLSLALDVRFVEADVLASHEHAVGLAVAVYID